MTDPLPPPKDVLRTYLVARVFNPCLGPKARVENPCHVEPTTSTAPTPGASRPPDPPRPDDAGSSAPFACGAGWTCRAARPAVAAALVDRRDPSRQKSPSTQRAGRRLGSWHFTSLYASAAR